MQSYVIGFASLTLGDVATVGGKNASLGEMVSHLNNLGVSVPNGFATTASAFNQFIQQNNLQQRIYDSLSSLDVEDVEALTKVGQQIRQWVMDTPFQSELEQAIRQQYQQLLDTEGSHISVAVRSSATAEDLPDASFAGQQESYLNVVGVDSVLDAVKKVFASLYNDRAIAYRVHQGFEHHDVSISAGIQRMVRSDIGSSGVMFTLDTESGFQDVVFITSSYGLGETVVQGSVNPDEFYVHKHTLLEGRPAILRRNRGSKVIKMVYGETGSTKTVEVPDADSFNFSITDADVEELARQALIVERHYQRPMDIEWGKDGNDGKIYILQARPETVKSQTHSATVERFNLKQKGDVLVEGRSIGQKIGTGPVRIIHNIKEMSLVQKGDVLVTDMTDPDWEPVMKRASAIVTNRGGRTCFAGDTQVLTNQGFMTFADIYQRGFKNLKIPSLNRETLKIEWKRITDSMRKMSSLIQINVPQTGRLSDNTLKLTPDHKMLNLAKGKLVDTEIQNLLDNDDCLLLAQQLPQLHCSTDKECELAYWLGQVATGEKSQVSSIASREQIEQQLIENTQTHIHEAYQQQQVECNKVVGGESWCSLKAYSEEIELDAQKLIVSLMKSDQQLAYSFLAGLIDGTGYEKQGKISFTVTQSDYLQAAIVACLRVGIVPQVMKQPHQHTITIAEQLEQLSTYTQHIKVTESQDSIRYFNTRQLFTESADKDIAKRIKNNFLLNEQGLNAALEQLDDAELTQDLQTLIDSDLRQARVNLVADLGQDWVYNITVEDHHNYIVFTENYTPVMVNNCHAAIIARELGIPAVVGCNDATHKLPNNEMVTVSCAEGDTGYIYKGELEYEVTTSDTGEMPDIPFKMMMNVGNPDRAFDFASLPNQGVGLARLEFIINRMIGIHPKALLNFDAQPEEIKQQIQKHISGYKDPVSFYVDRLAEGVSTLAAAFYPKPVIVRLSDFKSNEYANLIGGKQYEPEEENPMIGFRGASRYISESFQDCFALECQAMRKVRDEMGLTNVELMVPFVRTVDEARQVIEVLAQNGLERGKNGLRLIMMCELPSNALLAEQFLEYFDGFSIGSNDMTQLALGVDRDSGLVAYSFDERNDAVKALLHQAIQACRKQGKYVGICGQGPSDHEDFAKWLMDEGIGSVSLNPDTVVSTWLYLAGDK
ncbi:phosphoenolpyruvate synthase [Candidatus Albibeggiatoa sp. nov. NOAA]|uniref:phosphoenolpyruvate synthase n=1 Tax=Candidatus Albibeggiatoa sp. nov. NOAA TaxID=3162724 RepID=UPI0032FDE0B4|nr:phosphoenolpyruvate synthase [Thiotrichaceae bacterium]